LAGLAPRLTAIVLATLVLDVYFVSPVRGFTIHTADLPYMAQFVLPALLNGWFTKKRKEAETTLKDARDHLDAQFVQQSHCTNGPYCASLTLLSRFYHLLSSSQ
jgi:hypothetical protein